MSSFGVPVLCARERQPDLLRDAPGVEMSRVRPRPVFSRADSPSLPGRRRLKGLVDGTIVPAREASADS